MKVLYQLLIKKNIIKKGGKMKAEFFTKNSFLFLLLILLFTSLSFAQGSGRISGRVTDAQTGEALPSANVFIEGTSIGVSTDRFGNYRVDKVPVGTHNLKSSYIGYEIFSTEVEVQANRTLNLDIQLQISAVETEDIVVEGLRQGQVKALNQQMSAENIKNLISREEMEKFPDMNTAEVLQRMPGVAITRSQGEGRFVNIRGTEARLSTVTINGQKLASPQDEERFIGLDVINASQLAAIEVTKSLTPDMDGDAIGGTVNLITRSAFDYEKSVLKIDAGGGYAELGNKPLYRGSALYSTQLGENNNWGITLNANWYRSNLTTHSNEFDWDNIDDVNGNEIPFALADSRMYNYVTERDHIGFSADIEYKINNNNKFFLRGMFNRRTDDQTRNMVRWRFNRGDYLDATTVTKARLAFEMQNRNEIQDIMAFSGGGLNNFGNWDLDYTLHFSTAKETKTDPGQIKSEWQLNKRLDVIMDLSDVDFPKYDVTNMDDDYHLDAANWEIDNQDFREVETNNTKFLGSFNLKYPLRGSGFQAELKFGGKLQLDNKDRVGTRSRYRWRGAEKVFMSSVTSGEIINDFLDGTYVFGPMIDPDKFWNFFNQYRGLNDGLREDLRPDDNDGLGGRYDASENIYAAYLMTTFDLGEFTALVGVRNEYTQTTYEGNELRYDDSGDFLSSTKVTNENSYNNIFPYVHLKYKVTPFTNIRAAFTGSIARPNYFDLAPYRWIYPEDLEILEGNPDLEATTSLNFDVMFDHYFQGIGVISAGFFYKSLDKVAYPQVFFQEGGVFDGYEIEKPVNGGSAKLYGVEINWMQQFSFLPGFLSGFGIFANYTYTKSEAELEYRDWSTLPGQAGDVGNVGLSYEKGKLSARLSFNYQSEVLSQVGKNADYDRYMDKRLQVDFSGNYEIISGLNFYLDLINLTNAPERQYFGVTSRPRLNEFYSWSLRSGIKLSL